MTYYQSRIESSRRIRRVGLRVVKLRTIRVGLRVVEGVEEQD